MTRCKFQISKNAHFHFTISNLYIYQQFVSIFTKRTTRNERWRWPLDFSTLFWVKCTFWFLMTNHDIWSVWKDIECELLVAYRFQRVLSHVLVFASHSSSSGDTFMSTYFQEPYFSIKRFFRRHFEATFSTNRRTPAKKMKQQRLCFCESESITFFREKK